MVFCSFLFPPLVGEFSLKTPVLQAFGGNKTNYTKLLLKTVHFWGAVHRHRLLYVSHVCNGASIYHIANCASPKGEGFQPSPRETLYKVNKFWLYENLVLKTSYLIMKSTNKVKIINSFTVSIQNFSLCEDSQLLRDLFFIYPLVVLRNKAAFPVERLKDISKVFGDIYSYSHQKSLAQIKTLRKYHFDKECEILRVSNTFNKNGMPTGTLGGESLNWHTDLGHSDTDFYGSILYNRKNGNKAITSFCDSSDLIPLISDEEYEILKKSYGYHSLRKSYIYHRLHKGAYKMNLSVQAHMKQLKLLQGNEPEEFQKVVAKLMIMKTIREKEAFYLSPATLEYIDNNLEHLKYVRLIEKINHYHHIWEPNDILVYDNMSLLHKRSAVSGERIMYIMNFNYKNLLLESH